MNKLIAIALLLGAAGLPGCSSLPGTLKTHRTAGPAREVHKVLLVYQDRQKTKAMGQFGEALLGEVRLRLEARRVASLTYCTLERDVNLDTRLRALVTEQRPSHEFVVIPVFEGAGEESEPGDGPVHQITLGFTLAETDPHRLAWWGEAKFIGQPSPAEVADQLLARLVADGIVK